MGFVNIQPITDNIASISSNLYSTGQNINNSYSGLSGYFQSSLSSVTGTTNITSGVISLFGKRTGINFNSGQLYEDTLAGAKEFLIFNDPLVGENILDCTFYSRQKQIILPAATTTQLLVGNTASNVGTLSHVTTEVLGYMTNYIAATNFGAAGTSTNIANFYRGSVVGKNGFLFVTEFALLESGYDVSGLRFFAGMTDQTLTASVITNNPAGNRVGLSFVRASGGTQPDRYDTNWQISSKNNVTETVTNTPMNFQSGLYKFYLFSPPFPNNATMYWQLNDLTRSSDISGNINTNLPIGSTAMRMGVGIVTPSGARNVRTRIVYGEF